MRIRHFYFLLNLLKNQWKSSEEIERIQTFKLRRLIKHAYEKVPYYRELLEQCGIRPEDIRKAGDLRFLPLTDKKIFHDLRLNEKLATGVDPAQCEVSYTSGTTGVPLMMYASSDDASLMNLTYARAFISCGIKPWSKMAALVGKQEVRKERSWYEYLGLWRRNEISTWNKPEEWIREIQAFKPRALLGNAMTLRILAEAFSDSRGDNFAPELIFHCSTVLDDYTRRSLESILGARAWDIYGSNEAGCIAWECGKCGAYHLSLDTAVIEVLKNGRAAEPGEEGEIVITNLHSYAMPFIRYRQDDVGILSTREKSCGRGLPLLESIQGRIDDFIILKDGRKIAPQLLYHCLCPVVGVGKWRIIQEKIDRLVVEVEYDADASAQTPEKIRTNLGRLVGDALEIEITPVDSMEFDPSSKFRTVSSRVANSS